MPIPRTSVDLTPSHDALYEQILAAIIGGELAPGARLAEPELVERFATSRALLREALHRVAAVGLVEVTPRQHTQVTPLRVATTQEALAVVQAIVAQGISEGVPLLTDADRSRLVAYRGTALRDEASARESVRTNAVIDGLYGVFFDRVANPEYERLRGWLNPTLMRVHAFYADEIDATASLAHQRAVVDAALAGDVTGALAAWEANGRSNLPASLEVVSRREPPPSPPTLLLRDRVADLIQRSILDGTLVPGETLHESALMEWMNVSRTPVREALARLIARGLVEQAYHRPARVATLDPVAFQHAMRATGVLRRLVLREGVTTDPAHAASVTADAVAALDRGVPVLEAATTLADQFEERSSNAVLRELLGRTTARVRWYTLHDPAVSAALDAGLVRALHAAVVVGDLDTADALLDRLYTVDEHALTQPQESA
ncbi:GntR family transcriptional regulator [Cellulomonas sp. PhB150]|uniref:GntR family transcriptional regulator n=1 Tax=Cellulomonas sp. PhB150 TaxID=2485188 RepID=UPI000FB29C94|nr:GntR family transcriptional regulator [Cellulomonas sp. PhB150]ROS27907.1 DNA-binding GntR family transcriptional regulator [Cellulomonas sp. PhB150]